MSRLDDVAVLFTSCMKDPVRPKGCARLLCGCLHVLDGQSEVTRFALLERYNMPNYEDYEYIRRTYSEYLSACAAFLSLPLSAQDEEELNASLRTCTCFRRDERNPGELLLWLHTFETAHEFALDDFIQALIRHLAGILNNAVKTKTVPGVAALRGLKRYRKKYAANPPWPVDKSQLIPHGIEQSMKGYAEAFRWCPLDRFHDGLLLVDKLLAICGRSVIAHLLQFLPEFPIRITGLSNALCQECEATRGTTVDFGVERSWMCTLVIIVDFCRTLLTLGETTSTDISLFVRVAAPYKGTNRSIGLLFVCDTILNHLPLIRESTTLFTEFYFNEFAMTFARFGAIFYSYNSPEDTTVYHDAILLLHEELADDYEDSSKAAWEGFVWISAIRRCCAPECPETFVTAQRTFARCAGCGVPRYCSRECQKLAWKHAVFPHKDVCTKLRVLKERTNLPKDRVLTQNEHMPFIDACNADDELAALAQECGRHLRNMMKARKESVPEAFEAFQAKLAKGADPATK
ncbi:hypothetical protein EVJ58_g7677 [Rhodofomes roseus]|uniref:MYND-type domain-containing protein n=1 Tax=Rhodofomes roseus TaxID=34475 RepID=A0A4Y9Y2A6_9APHY|nr:hypothetical protein EVJ58_g7677 [Rhodofomes roseus]